MLLLLNGAFFAVNAFRDPKIAHNRASLDDTIITIPQLVLLDEKPNFQENAQKVTSKQPTLEKTEEPTLDLKTWLAKFTAETANEKNIINDKIEDTNLLQTKDTQCYTAGPFQTSENLQLASNFFNDSNIQFQQRSIVENYYIGMLVYIPSQPNRKSVIAMAETLAEKGVKDYMLLNEPGKKHSLSLGVYGLKKNAEQRIKTLAKLNYHAKSEARYRKKTIYWLDYELEDTVEQTSLSAKEMKSLNVSQIQRNCKS